jgi:hypothetical protein
MSRSDGGWGIARGERRTNFLNAIGGWSCKFAQ